MKTLGKKLALSLLVGIMAMIFTVPAMAFTSQKEIKKGQIYYVLDQKISTNQISKNQFQVQPLDADTAFDIVYASGTAASPSVVCLLNYKSRLTSQATNAYIKSSAGSDTGAVCGIRVTKGRVRLVVQSTSNTEQMALTLVSVDAKYTPLVAKPLAKTRSINFKMGAGNVANIPLIFGGVKGSKIKRTLSKTRYEVYSFGSSRMTRTVYDNGVKGATTKINYHSTYTTSGKTFNCTLIPIPATASTRSSGYMKNTKGTIRFFYPRQYLSIKGTLK